MKHCQKGRNMILINMFLNLKQHNERKIIQREKVQVEIDLN